MKSKAFVLMEYQGYDDHEGVVKGIYPDKKTAKKRSHMFKAHSMKKHWKWHDAWSYYVYEVDI